MKTQTELDRKFELKDNRDFKHQVYTHLIGNAIIGYGIVIALTALIMSIYDNI